jgi:hypothetical protein
MKASVITVCSCLLLLWCSTSQAQFKSQHENEPRVTDGMIRSSTPSFLFDWFNPEKFHMRHSLEFSYMSFGGQGFSLSTYTNSMTYQFADNLNARADVSLSYSPFSSSSFLNKGSDLSSIYLSRAQVDYRPWENVMIQFQYRQMPYRGYYSPFYNPWYTGNEFDR